MSDFQDCIANALKEGVIDEGEADAIAEAYQGHRAAREAAGEGSQAAADAATRDVFDALQAERARRNWHAQLNKKIAGEITAEIKRFRNGAGDVDIGEYLQAKIEYQGQGSGIRSSVANRRTAIVGRAHAQFEEALWTFRKGFGGRRVNKARLSNVVREAFGEDTGDASAKALSKAWRETAEGLRQRFNKAGGDVGKLENWGLPQNHNPRAIRNFIKEKVKAGEDGRKAFKDRLFNALDVERMIDHTTGKPLGRARVYGLLDGIIDNILTDGVAGRKPGRVPFGKGALANQRQAHRFLVFKNTDAWLEYQTDFGSGDPFSSMMGHLDGIAKDIAAMEVLGPNPNGTIEWLKQLAQGEAAKRALGKDSLIKPKLIARSPEAHIKDKAIRAQQMWDAYTGELNTPDADRGATWGANIRNVITSSALGAATLSALPTDPVFSAIARAYTGTSHGRWLQELTKQFVSRKSRRDAVRAGAIMDSALATFGQQARYAGTFSGQAWSNVLAEQTLAASGLTAWTRAGRHAFIRGAMADFADLSSKPFDALPDNLGRTLRRYDISAGEWEAMRKVDMGKGYLEPTALDEVSPGLADRYLEMLHAESEYAVPSGTLRSRSLLLQGTKPGSGIGELWRSSTMFMSFSATLPMLHGYRIAQTIAGGEAARGAKYATALLITMTVGGAMSQQLKQVAGGKDPRDMTDPKFWQAAAAQGGGAGIYGDFFFADVNRFGNSLPLTGGGPAIDLVNEVAQGTVGNIQKAARGEETDFLDDAARFIGRRAPGSNTWYLKLAWDRVVEDNLRRLANPDAAEASFRRRQSRVRSETGQDYFWAPGQSAPERLPDFEAAAGDS